MGNVSYDQQKKSEARRRLLSHAVHTLSGNSGSGPILSGQIVQRVAMDAAAYLENNCIKGKLTGLTRSMKPLLDEWRNEFAITQKYVSASAMRVLILAGPTPSKDVTELISLGVCQENIVAIEKDATIFSLAQEDLKEAGLCITLNKVSLVDYLKSKPDKFDIFYFDACGPFMGGHPNTLAPLLEALVNDCLADRCALISNYCRVPPEQIDRYASLCAAYFAPRYNDLPKAFWESNLDPTIIQHQPEALLDLIKSDIDSYYGDFITRFTIDLARYVIPVSRSLSFKETRNWMLAKPRKDVDKATESIFRPKTLIWDMGEQLEPEEMGKRFEAWHQEAMERHTWEWNPSSYPLYTFLEESRRITEDGTDPVGDIFRNYSINRTPIKNVLPLAFTLNAIFAGHWDVASERLKEILAVSWFDAKGGVFCDVPMPHLLIHALMGKSGRPFHPVAKDCLRVKYTAKANAMYSDCLIVDSCRPMYDYLPDPSSIAEELYSDVRKQLIVRTMMDRISWQDFGSSTHPFRGSALFSIGEKSYSQESCYPDRLEL